MARVVSLTLFLLSWLLLFSYAASYNTNNLECQVCTKVVDHIHQQVQKNSAKICPTKVEKVVDLTDIADSCSVKTYLIGELVNRVCYDLYPDTCSVKPPSTKDGIPSNNAEIVNKDSEQKTKGKKRKFSDRDDKTPSTKDGKAGQPLVPTPKKSKKSVSLVEHLQYFAHKVAETVRKKE